MDFLCPQNFVNMTALSCINQNILRMHSTFHSLCDKWTGSNISHCYDLCIDLLLEQTAKNLRYFYTKIELTMQKKMITYCHSQNRVFSLCRSVCSMLTFHFEHSHCVQLTNILYTWPTIIDKMWSMQQEHTTLVYHATVECTQNVLSLWEWQF